MQKIQSLLAIDKLFFLGMLVANDVVFLAIADKFSSEIKNNCFGQTPFIVMWDMTTGRHRQFQIYIYYLLFVDLNRLEIIQSNF